MNSKLALIVVLVVAAGIATRLLGVWGGTKDKAPIVVAGIVAPVAPAAPRGAQWIPDVAHDDDPVGEIRLEGQVIDASEQPVANARVAIDANPTKLATTDASGAFVFEGLIARNYNLEATSDSGYAGPVRLRLTARPEPVTLRVHAGATLTVAITEATSGAPIANADVEYRATVTYHASTDAKGLATLANVGAAFAPVVAHAAGHAPAAMMVSTSGDAAAPTRIALALVSGAPVTGRVVDDKTQPVGGAIVVAVPASEPFPVVDARRDGVTTKPDGTFTLAALAAGTYRLTATHSTFGPGNAPPITVDGEHARSGIEIALPAGATVKGAVTDKAGPVAGATVRVVVAGNTEWRAQRQAFTGADGTFTITGLERRAVDVVASDHRGSSAIANADLVAKPEVEVALSLDVIGTIDGIVVDKTNQGIGDAQVIAEPVLDGNVDSRAAWTVRGVQEAVTDQGGGFHFAGLPDGSYRVRAARPGAPASDLDLAPSVEAKLGGPKLRIVLANDGTIVGKVAFEDGTTPPAFTVALGASYPMPFASVDGTFKLSAPTGKVTLVVDGKTFLAAKAKDVTVSDGKPVDVGTIVVEPGRSVSGRVLDQTGAPIVGAKVAAGVLLTGGGQELYIPDESVGAKETTSDAEGRYRIEGFSPTPITIVAGNARGRSASVQLPAGSDSASLDLVLKPTSGLDGTITRDGKPLGDTIVIANPIGATHANFFTSTGADGTFALDTLTAGPYVVYPIIGGGGSRPKDMYVVKAQVGSGARAHLTIDTTPGPAKLAVTIKTDAGQPVAMAMVFLIQAQLNIQTSSELRDLDQLNVFNDNPTPVYMRGGMGGAAEIDHVRTGKHTLCVMPLDGPPDPIAPPGPVKCIALDVTAAANQPVTVVVPTKK